MSLIKTLNFKKFNLEFLCVVATLMTVVLGIALCSYIVEPTPSTVAPVGPKKAKKQAAKAAQVAQSNTEVEKGLSIAFIIFWLVSLLCHLRFGDKISSTFVLLTALTLVTCAMVLQNQIDYDTVELSKAALAFNVICLMININDVRQLF